MEAARLGRMTEREYLEFERAAEARHEFVDGEVIARTGSGPLHAAVTASLGAALGVRLDGSPCLPFSSDLRVHTPATGLYCYPDLTVVCGAPEYHPDEPQVVTNPTLVVEVLSPATRAHDQGAKLSHYRAHPSIQAILLVDPETGELDAYTRLDDRAWRVERLVAGDELFIAALGDLRIPVADLFRGTEHLRGQSSAGA